MAIINDNATGMYMPVAPAYGGYGNNGLFGGDNGWWIILLLLCGWGGMGMGGWGGFGGFGGALGYDFPWLLNGQNQINANTNSGFRDSMLNDGINSIRDGISGLSTQICGLGGDISTQLCSGFAGTTAAVNGVQNALAQQLYTNQIADMERSYAAQTANTQGLTALQSQLASCCCENRLATADTKYTIATEACANRTAAAENTRDIIDSQTRGTQAILDKLCQLELDGVKGQLAQAQRENVGLQNQLNMASFRESQANQNALFQQGLNNEVDALYNRLSSCPIPSTPVYGRQNIFNCGGNGYTGCGCAA